MSCSPFDLTGLLPEGADRPAAAPGGSPCENLPALPRRAGAAATDRSGAILGCGTKRSRSASLSSPTRFSNPRRCARWMAAFWGSGGAAGVRFGGHAFGRDHGFRADAPGSRTGRGSATLRRPSRPPPCRTRRSTSVYRTAVEQAMAETEARHAQQTKQLVAELDQSAAAAAGGGAGIRVLSEARPGADDGEQRVRTARPRRRRRTEMRPAAVLLLAAMGCAAAQVASTTARVAPNVPNGALAGGRPMRIALGTFADLEKRFDGKLSSLGGANDPTDLLGDDARHLPGRLRRGLHRRAEPDHHARHQPVPPDHQRTTERAGAPEQGWRAFRC